MSITGLGAVVGRTGEEDEEVVWFVKRAEAAWKDRRGVDVEVEGPSLRSDGGRRESLQRRQRRQRWAWFIVS